MIESSFQWFVSAILLTFILKDDPQLAKPIVILCWLFAINEFVKWLYKEHNT